MLGWQAIKEGEYKLNIPLLSDEEEFIILEIEKRFREIARIENIENEETTKTILKDILYRVADENNLEIDKDQETYLVEMAFRHIYGLFFLDDLIKDDRIEEIAIIGLNKPVFVYLTNEGWKQVNVMITSEKALIDLINKIGKSLGRRITLQHPRLDTMLPDGSRLHASIKPISDGEMTIRKFKEKPLSPKHIISFGTGPTDLFALLSIFMQSDSSIIIAGNTASGKTTTLNSLFSFTPLTERILITEETPEINIPHLHTVRLVANENLGISLMDLVYDSLRMRPDRIIVGEVRNKEESRALLDVLLGGQARGVYATFHAQSAAEALNRFMSFGIPKIDLDSIDLILVQRRMLKYNVKKRKNQEIRKITELAVVEKGNVERIYKYDILSDSWKKRSLKKLYNILEENIGLTVKEIEQEVKKREKIIKKAPAIYKDFFEFIQSSFYGVKL